MSDILRTCFHAFQLVFAILFDAPTVLPYRLSSLYTNNRSLVWEQEVSNLLPQRLLPRLSLFPPQPYSLHHHSAQQITNLSALDTGNGTRSHNFAATYFHYASCVKKVNRQHKSPGYFRQVVVNYSHLNPLCRIAFVSHQHESR